MGIKDMGKAIVTTGAGLVSPLHGMGAVLLTETMDFFLSKLHRCKER